MSSRTKILIIEDSLSMGMLCSEFLEKAGYEPHHVMTKEDGLSEIGRSDFALVLIDLGLPDGNGLDILKDLNSRVKSPSVIIITAEGSVKSAVDAMKNGANDFLMKPFSEQRLITSIKNVLETQELRKTVEIITSTLDRKSFYGFIGQSTPMQVIYKAIENVSNSTASIFISGESGTGKEVCSEAIHNAGKRKGKAFVPLNCAAIPKDLIESEIFGHKKGSFTGAISDKDGAAKVADGGTLFLDEICEMDINLQSKLLRFLQSSKIQKVGSSTLEKVDVRVICATNKDPIREVEAGRFREDLFYRLNVIPINLPPLRDRQDDVVEIAKHFLVQYGALEEKEFPEFSGDVLDAFKQYRWPGNVRELQNVIRQITVMNPGGIVQTEMLGNFGISPSIEHSDTVENNFINNSSVYGHAANTNKTETLDEINYNLINERINSFNGSIPKAAISLGLSPSTLYRKLEGWKNKKHLTKILTTDANQ